MTMFMVVMALLLILTIIYIRKGIDLNDIISGISSKERNY